jgi:hypothetical protein
MGKVPQKGLLHGQNRSNSRLLHVFFRASKGVLTDAVSGRRRDILLGKYGNKASKEE